MIYSLFKHCQFGHIVAFLNIMTLLICIPKMSADLPKIIVKQSVKERETTTLKCYFIDKICY